MDKQLGSVSLFSFIEIGFLLFIYLKDYKMKSNDLNVILALKQIINENLGSVRCKVENNEYFIDTHNSILDDVRILERFIQNYLINNKLTPINDNNNDKVQYIIIFYTFTLYIKTSLSNINMHLNISHLIETYYTDLKLFYSFLKYLKTIYLSYNKYLKFPDYSNFSPLCSSINPFFSFPEYHDLKILIILIYSFLDNPSPSFINPFMFIKELQPFKENFSDFVQANINRMQMFQNVISVFSNKKINDEIFSFFDEIYNSRLFICHGVSNVNQNMLLFKHISNNKMILYSGMDALYLQICLSKKYEKEYKKAIALVSKNNFSKRKIILSVGKYKNEYLKLIENDIIEVLNIWNESMQYEMILMRERIEIMFNINVSNEQLIEILEDIGKSLIVLNNKKMSICFGFSIRKNSISKFNINFDGNNEGMFLYEEKRLGNNSIDNNEYIEKCNGNYHCIDFILKYYFSSYVILYSLFSSLNFRKNNLPSLNHNEITFNLTEMFHLKMFKNCIQITPLHNYIKSKLILIINNLSEIQDLINNDWIELPSKEIQIIVKEKGNKIGKENQIIKHKRGFKRCLPIFTVLKRKWSNAYVKPILFTIVNFIAQKVEIKIIKLE